MDQFELNKLFTAFPVALLLVKKNGDIIAASNAATSILGAQHGQLVTANLSKFSQFTEQEIVEILKQCSRSTTPILVPLKLINTETQSLLSSRGCLFKASLPEDDGINKIILHLEYQSTFSQSLVELNRQINKQKMLINELNQTNSELQRINSDLESFAYIASHDLRSPLRAIYQLASWLKEDLEGKIDKNDLSHLYLMQSRINRMERLLDDLLAFSRAGVREEFVEMTDVNLLISNVFETLNVDQSFSLKIENALPLIQTNRIPLEQIFLNLINNAIKHHDQGTGEITVKYSEIGQFHQFEIADDGPGIPSEFTDIVFTMFKTLRPRDEVEGSGIGLAIVKKIVESCGGAIKLMKNTPRGARFVFTWPIK
ncbi:MAG: ATP-binding protein [Alishewanella sp.]|nr:ATP-binding protein [Alishewanella sp.]